MTDEIKRAMDARLAALEGSETRRAQIRARIARESKEEEPVVKRKLSVAMALVLALMLLGGTALAAGLGLNLFEILGKKEVRWLSVADKSVLATQVPVTTRHDVLGEAVVTMTNAYYDGQGLSIAYALENWRCFELWTPTEEEKERGIGDKSAEGYLKYLMTDGFFESVADGEAYGVAEYMILPNGPITANGMMLPPGELVGGYQENGSYYEIMDYGMLLPEGVADQEKLEINVTLSQLVRYHWYDDGQWHSGYWYTDTQHTRDDSVITATVYRDHEASIKRFTGTAEYKGMPVTVTADISKIHGDVIITAQGDAFFHTTKEGLGILMGVWEMALADDQGRSLYADDSVKPVSPRELRFTCHGTGYIPESLTMQLYEYDRTDDAVSEEEAKAQGVTITLLPAE